MCLSLDPLISIGSTETFFVKVENIDSGLKRNSLGLNLFKLRLRNAEQHIIGEFSELLHIQ